MLFMRPVVSATEIQGFLKCSGTRKWKYFWIGKESCLRHVIKVALKQIYIVIMRQKVAKRIVAKAVDGAEHAFKFYVMALDDRY